MSQKLNYATLYDATPAKSRTAVIIGHLCALSVAVFFLYAAYGKIVDVRQFAINIKIFRMAFMDDRYVNIPAIVLPWIEVVGALALIIPATRKGAALVIGGLLLFFIYAVFDAAIIRGLSIDCGCFGKDSGKAGWLTIGRNVLLLAATMASVYLPTVRGKLNPSAEASPVASGAAA